MKESFPSVEFLRCLAKTFAMEPQPAMYCSGKECVLTLKFGSGRFLQGHPLIDFFELEPSDQVDSDSKQQISKNFFLNRTVLDIVEARSFTSSSFEETNFSTVAPFIKWSHFPSWEIFMDAINQNKKGYWKDSSRQRRRLISDHGSVDMLFNSNDPRHLELLFDWKSHRLQSMGEKSVFNVTANQNFLKHLHSQGELILSTLTAGEKIVAIHGGLRSKNRFIYWLPAFNPNYKAYSVGRLLLENLMENSYKNNNDSFEFMNGAEEYKFLYANFIRIIGCKGKPPIGAVLKSKVGLWHRRLRRRVF